MILFVSAVIKNYISQKSTVRIFSTALPDHLKGKIITCTEATHALIRCVTVIRYIIV